MAFDFAWAAGLRPLLGVLACAAVAGCSGGSQTTASNCKTTTAPKCNGSPPSYASDVAPILAHRCQPCHWPGGEEQVKPLTSYDNVIKQAGRIPAELTTCQMPPPSEAPGLPDDERQVILMWVACDLPDN